MKGDLTIGEGDQAVVGDGHAMGVAAEILQHVFRAPEGRFQVDHPVLSIEGSQPGSESLGLSEEFQVFREAQLAVLEGLLERVDKLATKDFPQHLFRKKVIFSRANPTGVIGREAAGGNDTMDMRMKIKLLAPAMQDAEETDLCAEVSGVARHFEKGFRTATKEEIVEELLFCMSSGIKRVRKVKTTCA